VLSVVALSVSARPKWTELSENYSWKEYKHDLGKRYSGAEDGLRREIFEKNLKTILRHNANPDASYRMGVNHMTDWTEGELKSTRGYYKSLGFQQVQQRQQSRERMFVNPGQAAPHEVDWRGKGVLTSVKDQGQCGSCWSFASSEAIESAWAIATGELSVLSEQHILSCTPNPDHCGGDGGCMGGTSELAFASMINTGIASEWKYPYLSWYGNNSKCMYNDDKVGYAAKISDYVTLESNNYDDLVQAVAFVGPIAISVDASNWHLYESGVYTGCDMDQPDIDHAVLLVGYGMDQSLKLPYWTIRNSWTPTFGEDGYIRVYRDGYDTPVVCGVDTTPLDGIACVGGPSNQTVCGSCGVLFDSSYPIASP